MRLYGALQAAFAQARVVRFRALSMRADLVDRLASQLRAAGARRAVWHA
jgi:hypothetical protein